MTPKDRWIDEGMATLRQEGIAGVRIDRLAARLGLTKGSFHHHFNGVGDYRRALLERFETEAKAMIEKTVTVPADLAVSSAQRILTEAPTHVSIDPRTEAAFRGWAFQDAAARATLQRIDAARLQALTALWRSIVPDESLARSAALIPHLIAIGASVTVPTPTAKEMTDVFALLAALVPSVPSAAPAPDQLD